MSAMRKNMRHICATLAILIVAVALYACMDSPKSEVSTLPPASPSQNETPSASQGAPSTAARQPDDAIESVAPSALSGEVAISLEYVRQSGSASNQYAVWIEDMGGKLLKTLYATQWTANGGYKTRPDSIALWVEKSNLAAMTESEVDAIGGATPRTGTQTYTWDLTDADGGAVSPGEYRFVVEGTLRWKNSVVYSGVIAIGDVPVTVQAGADFTYEASDRQAALTGDSPENSMIGSVTASYTCG
jgi:hypothetical protein